MAYNSTIFNRQSFSGENKINVSPEENIMNRTKTALAIFLLLAFSLFTNAQNPTVDAGFAPAFSKPGNPLVFNYTFQPDGKIIVAGNFSVVNGQIRAKSRQTQC